MVAKYSLEDNIDDWENRKSEGKKGVIDCE